MKQYIGVTNQYFINSINSFNGTKDWTVIFDPFDGNKDVLIPLYKKLGQVLYKDAHDFIKNKNPIEWIMLEIADRDPVSMAYNSKEGILTFYLDDDWDDSIVFFGKIHKNETDLCIAMFYPSSRFNYDMRKLEDLLDRYYKDYGLDYPLWVEYPKSGKDLPINLMYGLQSNFYEDEKDYTMGYEIN